MAPRYETFLRSVQVRPERIPDPHRYPFSIPAIHTLGTLAAAGAFFRELFADGD